MPCSSQRFQASLGELALVTPFPEVRKLRFELRDCLGHASQEEAEARFELSAALKLRLLSILL